MTDKSAADMVTVTFGRPYRPDAETLYEAGKSYDLDVVEAAHYVDLNLLDDASRAAVGSNKDANALVDACQRVHCGLIFYPDTPAIVKFVAGLRSLKVENHRRTPKKGA